jgi:hypothetical protein
MKNFAQQNLNSELQLLEANLNETVHAFEQCQPFETIKTAEEAKKLVADPLSYYDKVMFRGLNINEPTGSVSRILAKQIACRYKIRREAFIDAARLPINCSQFPEYDFVKASEEMLTFFTWEGAFRLRPGVIENQPVIDSFTETNY